VRSAITYAVALHELGHYLGEHTNHPDRIVRERAAWRWARASALTWTTGMERCQAWTLASDERGLCAACPPRGQKGRSRQGKEWDWNWDWDWEREEREQEFWKRVYRRGRPRRRRVV